MSRPRRFLHASDLKKRIEEYFKDCEVRDKPPTIHGLCYWLDYEDRSAWYKLKEHPIFGHTIKMTQQRLCQYWEEHLTRGCNNGGIIFALKNIAGWSDKMDVDMTSAGEKIQNQPTIIISNQDTKNSLEEAVSELDNKDDTSVRYVGKEPQCANTDFAGRN